jgi:uncharacterized lipoprotein YddW (UPF0748 family)
MDRKTFISLGVAGSLGLTGITKLPAFPLSNTKNWAWVTRYNRSEEEWREQFGRMSEAGVDGILISRNFDELIPMATDQGLEVHAWLIALQRGDDEFAAENHPEWFMVNRQGDSSLEQPPYVEYYKWLCPSREEVHAYLLDEVEELLQHEELGGIHLDYIRYPDVILPIALQSDYDLVQDHEMPQYDFCYCEVCREHFRERSGLDPFELLHPDESEAWRQYRYDQVTLLVNRISERVYESNRQLSAAVFATPEIARSLVRQNWPDWNLDAVFPMQYHSFYHEPVEWIGEAVKQGRAELPGTTPMYSGLYLPGLDPVELSRGAKHALDSGASGVSLFHDYRMTDEHWEYLRRVLMRG